MGAQDAYCRRCRSPRIAVAGRTVSSVVSWAVASRPVATGQGPGRFDGADELMQPALDHASLRQGLGADVGQERSARQTGGLGRHRVL